MNKLIIKTRPSSLCYKINLVVCVVDTLLHISQSYSKNDNFFEKFCAKKFIITWKQFGMSPSFFCLGADPCIFSGLHIYVNQVTIACYTVKSKSQCYIYMKMKIQNTIRNTGQINIKFEVKCYIKKNQNQTYCLRRDLYTRELNPLSTQD